MTTVPKKVRWIGFDMDHCIGHVMPACRFAQVFKPGSVAAALLPYEMSGETWLLRPGFIDVIIAVAQAYKRQDIIGAFVYSNNKNKTTVEFAQALLNLIATEICSVAPFLAGFHRKHAARSSESEKRYEDICNMLHTADLPIPSSPVDIIFFDDQMHPLATETPHYFQVPKYKAWTRVDKLVEALDPLRQADPKLFNHAATFTYLDQLELTEPILQEAPPLDRDAIQKFLLGIQAGLASA